MIQNNKEKLCQNCLLCASICPQKLKPNYMYFARSANNNELLNYLNFDKCNLCGKCTSICPESIDLAQTFKNSRNNTNKLDLQNKQIKLPINAKLKNISAFNCDILALMVLLPLYAAAISKYGLKILLTLFLSIITGIITDKLMHKFTSTSKRYNFLFWFLIPLALPSGISPYSVISAVVFSSVIGLHFFGGYKKNFVNIVALSIVFLYLSFPTKFINNFIKPFAQPFAGLKAYATLVPISNEQLTSIADKSTLNDLLFGKIPGTAGDLFPIYNLAIMIWFLYLKIIDKHFTLASIISMFLFSYTILYFKPDCIPNFKPQILYGSFLSVLTFYLIDKSSLARTLKTRILSGCIFSALTILFRLLTDFNTGVFFALLFTNIITPFIDYIVVATLNGKPLKNIVYES